MINLRSIPHGRDFVIGACLLFITFALVPSLSHSQEIEARTYSNTPIGINFLSAGVVQAKTNNYSLTSEVISLTHIFDAGGQSGKLTLVLPYAQFSGSK